MSSKDLGAEQTDRSCSEVYRSFVEQVFGEHANKHAAVPVVGFGLDRMLNCAQCEWTLSVQSGEVRACAYEREPVGKSSLLLSCRRAVRIEVAKSAVVSIDEEQAPVIVLER